MRTFNPQLLRYARKQAGLTQAKLAQKARISRSAIAAIELGVHVPLSNTLAVLSTVLGRPETYFFVEDFQTTKQDRPDVQNA